MCTDVNACDCTRGCTDTVRESALKVDSRRNIPCHTGKSNPSVMCQSNALPNELHPNPTFALLKAWDQSTVAWQAEMTVDKQSLLKLHVSSFSLWVPTLSWVSIVSSLQLCWVEGACVFSCNLPPALLAE